jgi:hypothetical protein
MIDTPAHTAALEWITRALTAELPHEDAGNIQHRAETLAAIAAAEGIPVEVLIEWIHIRHRGKNWSPAEWRSFSAKYAQTVRALLAAHGDPRDFAICRHCRSHIAQRIGPHMLCPQCGEAS